MSIYYLSTPYWAKLGLFLSKTRASTQANADETDYLRFSAQW
jgi:hypothetical protein